jgi:acid phosphatase family membrane protein YuiD
MHAQVLNRVVNEMRESEADVPGSMDDVGPLKEVLGHTPRQVRGLKG